MFQPGVSGNPRGRKVGTQLGRAKALGILDSVLGESRSRSILKKALRQELAKNPVGFFKSVIMPLLPRDSRLQVQNGGVIAWQSLLGGGGERGALPEKCAGDSAAGASGESGGGDSAASASGESGGGEG